MPTSSVLDRYRYISRLGTGGFSIVHLAEDTVLGRRVALKRIHTPDDASARSRLRREALIGASLSHPNLISIFDIVTTDEGEDVIVMEYVEGETLADRLRRGSKPDVQEALEMLTGVASALDAIHAEGIIHRDVKPSNVLLGLDGGVKLATQAPPDLRNVWPEAPAAAAKVLTGGMSRGPRTRPRSAGKLIARLREALESRPVVVPASSDRRMPRGAVLAALASLFVAAAIAAIVLASSGAFRKPLAARSPHRSARADSSSRGAAASASRPSATSAGTSPSAGAPVSAVESFYHLAASHQYAAAWAFADPAFRRQLQGYEGLQATMAHDRSITFNSASVVNQSSTSATVAVRTTSIQDAGTQTCSGTVNLVHAGGSSASWLLDHIQISCV